MSFIFYKIMVCATIFYKLSSFFLYKELRQKFIAILSPEQTNATSEKDPLT